MAEEGRAGLEVVARELVVCELGSQQLHQLLLEDEFLVGQVDGVHQLAEQFQIHPACGTDECVGQQHGRSHLSQGGSLGFLGLCHKGAQAALAVALLAGPRGDDPVERCDAVSQEPVLFALFLVGAGEGRGGLGEDLAGQVALALRHGVDALQQQV